MIKMFSELKSYAIISLLFSLTIVVYSCTNKPNDSAIKNSSIKECPDGCTIGSVKCDWYNDWYYKWYCEDTVRTDICGRWVHEFNVCDLPDLDVLDTWVSRLSVEVEEKFNMYSAIEIHGPQTPSGFNFSFILKDTNDDTIFINKSSGFNNWKYQKLDYSEIIWANTSFVFQQPGKYEYLFVLDENNNIIEADESNNKKSIGIYVRPKAGEIILLGIFNEFKKNGSINKTIFNKLKQIIYCDSSLNCTLLENIKIYFKNGVDQIFDYLVPNATIFNMSSEEFYYFIKNNNVFNLTYCNQSQNIYNKTSDEFYVLEPNSAGHYGSPFCNLYDIKFLDNTNYNYISNPEIPLLKINSEQITPQMAIDSILYYNIIEHGFLVLRTAIDNIHFKIYEAGNNYIVHVFHLPKIKYEYNDCYEGLIYYDIFKVNKKDKILTKLNKGYKKKVIGKCAKEKELTDEELKEIEKIRQLYYKEVNLKKIDFNQLLESKKSNLSDKFIEWMKLAMQWGDFSHPHVQRVLRKQANGTFEISIQYYNNFTQEQIRKELGNFGELSFSHCISNYCRVYINIQDIFMVDKFINKPFIISTHLSDINSDYSPNPLILNFCENDDCAPAQCCHLSSTVNKEFAPYCRNTGCIAVCSGPLDCGAGRPACINNKCSIIRTGTIY